MSANVEGMVREGVSAFKAGRVDEARALLTKAVELDPYNEQAWLWLSGVVPSAEDQRTCLENVLAINPGNSRARSGLDFLVGQSAPPESEPPEPEPPAPAPEPPAAPPVFTGPANVSSVEWGAYAAEPEEEDWSSPAPAPAGDYDDWVSGLQLSSAETTATQPDDLFAAAPGTSPFFNSGDLLAGQSGVTTHMASPAFALPPEENTPAAAPPPVRLPLHAAYDSDAVAIAAQSAGSAYMDEIELDDEEMLDAGDGEEFFAGIPREIKATRLPGTHQRGPLLLKLAVLALIPLNFAAALLLLWRLL